MEKKDVDDLRRAIKLLEKPGLSIRLINLLFINHFQAAARGHFIVRRLERKYGGDFVKEEYEKVLREV